MRKLRKRIFSCLIACMLACIMFTLPVYAANGSFSKTTVKLNAMNGGYSVTSYLTSGSIPDGAYITSVKVNVKVASGTDPYTLYIESPEGTIGTFPGPTSTSSFVTHIFDGESPAGTWAVWIKNGGISYIGNIYPTSTVTVTLTIYYSY